MPVVVEAEFTVARIPRRCGDTVSVDGVRCQAGFASGMAIWNGEALDVVIECFPHSGGTSTSLPVNVLARNSVCTLRISLSGNVFATTGRISPCSM